MPAPFPFSAIVSQDEMKLAILFAAVDPSVGGVLVFGDRGTGKSTAVRALAALLPKMRAVVGCRYGCDPAAASAVCEECASLRADGTVPKSHLILVPVVDLLIDVAASGENVVEREGLSVRHPARFVLVGSGNPEEGELRAQLLDRFGLSLDVSNPTDIALRVEVVRRRDAFDRDPQGFTERWKKEDEKVRRRIVAARTRLPAVTVPDAAVERAARLCMALGTDGLRGELTLIRAARSLAALEGDDEVGDSHLRQVAGPPLRHRLRRNPLDDSGSSVRVERAVSELFGAVAA